MRRMLGISIPCCAASHLCKRMSLALLPKGQYAKDLLTLLNG